MAATKELKLRRVIGYNGTTCRLRWPVELN